MSRLCNLQMNGQSQAREVAKNMTAGRQFGDRIATLPGRIDDCRVIVMEIASSALNQAVSSGRRQ
jgi:hypothetical protein